MKKTTTIKEQGEGFQSMIQMEPLAAGERLLTQFSNEVAKALTKAHNAVGDEAVREALLEAGAFYRRWYAFSHDMTEATGKGIYRRQWDFHRRLTEHERDLWCRVPSRHLPSLPYPKEAENVLARLRAIRKPEKPLTLPVEEPYQSRTGLSRRSRSID